MKLKEDVYFEMEGIVINTTSNATFKIKLNNNIIITAYISGKMRKNYIKIMIGDKVKVMLSYQDVLKGRIIHRF